MISGMHLRALSVGLLLAVPIVGCTPKEPGPDGERQPEPEPRSEAEPEAQPEPEMLTGIVQVVAGGSATCALDGTGAVYCWGLFTDGTYEDPSVPLFGFPARRPVRLEGPGAMRITAYPRGVGMLDASGSVFAAGRIERGGAELRGFERIAGEGMQRLFGARSRATPMCWLRHDATIECGSGEHHAVASGILLDERAAGCFALGNAVQCSFETQSFVVALERGCSERPDEIEGVHRFDFGMRPSALYSSSQAVCGISEEGALECLRYESTGRTEFALSTSGCKTTDDYARHRSSWAGPFVDAAVSGTSGRFGYGARSDGTVVNLDDGSAVPGAEHVVQLTAAVGHTCGLRSDGRVSCWGDNEEGQLGSGSTSRPDAKASTTATLVLSPQGATPMTPRVTNDRGRTTRSVRIGSAAAPPRLCPVGPD